MTQYSMTPLGNGTRIRTDHTTYAAVIASYSYGQLVVGDEMWEAPADGSEVKKGDKWLHVTHVDGVPVAVQGWMAYIHKGSSICNNFRVIDGETEPPVVVPPPTTEPQFPQSFVLTDPNGHRAEFKFVRLLEEGE